MDSLGSGVTGRPMAERRGSATCTPAECTTSGWDTRGHRADRLSFDAQEKHYRGETANISARDAGCAQGNFDQLHLTDRAKTHESMLLRDDATK